MNDDLISRQAAIDAIKDFKQGAAEWKDEQEEGSDIWHRADSAIGTALEIGLRIKKLPSAQPERKNGKWMLLSEKVPEMDERVLVIDNGYEYHFWDCMSNRGDEYFWEDEEGLCHNKYEVVAWLPFPEVIL